MEWNSQTVLMIFVALTGLAVLLQACVLVGILIALRKTAQQSMELAEDMRANVIPAAQSARELLEQLTPFLERLAPQVIAVSSNLAEVTRDIREETAEFRRTATDLNLRLQRQTARIDSMLSTSLDRVENLSTIVESVVITPVRQANGVVLAFKAAVETYFGMGTKPKPTTLIVEKQRIF